VLSVIRTAETSTLLTTFGLHNVTEGLAWESESRTTDDKNRCSGRGCESYGKIAGRCPSVRTASLPVAATSLVAQLFPVSHLQGHFCRCICQHWLAAEDCKKTCRMLVLSGRIRGT
jgi:hypothetical protein